MKEELKKQIITAMKAGDTLRVSTLKLLSNAIHNEEIAKQKDLTGDEEVAIIRRQLKQRDEAIGLFEKGGRPELADKEREEALILREFLPEEMSEEELGKIVEGVIARAETPEFGRVMGAVMAKVGGRANGSIVSKVVGEKLKS